MNFTAVVTMADEAGGTRCIATVMHPAPRRATSTSRWESSKAGQTPGQTAATRHSGTRVTFLPAMIMPSTSSSVTSLVR